MEITFIGRNPRIDPRREAEREFSRIIQEDHYAPSNCPQKPIYQEFNRDNFFLRKTVLDQGVE